MPLPPPQPPLPPDKKPISPPLGSLPHHKPPARGKAKSLILAVVFGTLIAGFIGLILYYLNISISVILPVLAPIWVGTITLIYCRTKRVKSKNFIFGFLSE